MKRLFAYLFDSPDDDSVPHLPTSRRTGIGLMTIMLLAVLLLASIFLAPSAKAQSTSPTSITITNVIPATSTNSSLNGDITVVRNDLVALQVVLALQGSGTTAITFDVHESLDGTTYDDTAVSTITVTPSGTNTVCSVVPISPGAVGYLRIKTGRNANASAITNMVWKKMFKPFRQAG